MSVIQKVTLTADPVVHAAWSALDPKILAKPHPGPGYRPVAADLDGIGHAIDARLLRLLDGKLSAVFASGKHARLGPISPDIVTPVEATFPLDHPPAKEIASSGLLKFKNRLVQ